MNAKDAAEKIRPDFHLEAVPPEDRHHVKFVEDVASELGIAHTHFNIYQVASALEKAGIAPDSNEYPKMLYSRTHHAEEGVAPSFYEKRHDFVCVHVANEDEARKLGSGFVENPADLPPRGELPLYADPKVPEPADPAKEDETTLDS